MNPLPVCKSVFPNLAASADFKLEPEDFIVVEELGFEPEGSGEHLFLFVEKKNLTTDRLIGDIARSLDLKKKQVAYSGLKDKDAITRQWISVPWPIKQNLPDANMVVGESWKVLEMKRHLRKLKKGVHKANHFTITLKNVVGEQSDIDERLQQISEQGVPNYFGPQRFGFGGQNVSKAKALFAGELKLKPAQRSIYYSAARSYLFNQYLSKRIEAGFYLHPVDGDVFMLEGTHSVFAEDSHSEKIVERFNSHDIHSCGVLYGQGQALQGEAQTLWSDVVTAETEVAEGLMAAGLKSSYRALRLPVKALNWKWNNDNQCKLEFTLPSGSFATAVLHEVIIINEAQW